MTSSWPWLPLIGGALMGVAGVLLFMILSPRRGAGAAAGKDRRSSRLQILGFAVGVPLGAWLVSLVVRDMPAPPVLVLLLVGLVFGLVTATLAARRGRAPAPSAERTSRGAGRDRR